MYWEWKPTCLFLEIFLFETENFFNPEVLSLLFNKRHVSVMIKMRIINKEKHIKTTSP